MVESSQQGILMQRERERMALTDIISFLLNNFPSDKSVDITELNNHLESFIRNYISFDDFIHASTSSSIVIILYILLVSPADRQLAGYEPHYGIDDAVKYLLQEIVPQQLRILTSVTFNQPK